MRACAKVCTIDVYEEQEEDERTEEQELHNIYSVVELVSAASDEPEPEESLLLVGTVRSFVRGSLLVPRSSQDFVCGGVCGCACVCVLIQGVTHRHTKWTTTTTS